MKRRSLVDRIVPCLALGFAFASACSSSTHRMTSTPSEGGEAGFAGDVSGGRGGDASVPSGAAGASGSLAEAGSAGEPAAAGASAGAAGASGSDAAGTSGDGGSGGSGTAVPVVSAFGCFGKSGDGMDLLADDSPAVVLNGVAPYGAPCDSQWISDNANAYAPETPPTSIVLRRSFIVDPALLANGSFSVSFKADDAVKFVFNGQALAECMPPDLGANIGACQQSCRSTTIPTSLLLGEGQVNTLEIELLNLQSVPAADGNFGYTAVSYSMCVEPNP